MLCEIIRYPEGSARKKSMRNRAKPKPNATNAATVPGFEHQLAFPGWTLGSDPARQRTERHEQAVNREVQAEERK